MRSLSLALICLLFWQTAGHCQDLGSKLLNQAKQVGSKQASQLLKSVTSGATNATAASPSAAAPTTTVPPAATEAKAGTAPAATGAAGTPAAPTEKATLTDKAKGLVGSNALKYGKKYGGQYLGKGKGELNKLLDKGNLK